MQCMQRKRCVASTNAHALIEQNTLRGTKSDNGYLFHSQEARSTELAMSSCMMRLSGIILFYNNTQLKLPGEEQRNKQRINGIFIILKNMTLHDCVHVPQTGNSQAFQFK